MIKLAIAAGLTFSILCGLMTLQQRQSFFGGNKDLSVLTGLKETLGLSGSGYSNANSKSSNGYLPPQSSNYLPPKDEQIQELNVDLTTPLFRIHLLSTVPSSTTPSSTTKMTTSENPTDNFNLRTTGAPNTSTKANEIAPSDYAHTTVPNLIPNVAFQAAGNGGEAMVEMQKPEVKLQPPTTTAASYYSDSASTETQKLKENISPPENELKPPNGLYLPPNM